MKKLVLSLMIVCASIATATTVDDLARVKKVYVLSMGNGLDQYIANRLTASGPFEIVTDPKTADALLTDHIGETFERKYSELYPETDPDSPQSRRKAKAEAKKAEAKEAKSGDEKSDKSDKRDKDADDSTISANDRPLSSFSRGRGNVFLIDRATRKVIWSTYEKPKNRSSQELNHVANKIAKDLRKAAMPSKQ